LMRSPFLFIFKNFLRNSSGCKLCVYSCFLLQALDSLDMLDSMDRARDLVGTEGRELDLEVEQVVPGHLLHTLLLGVSLAATLLLLCLILALTCKASSSYSKYDTLP